jgi:S1 RNA binding domain protein
MQLEIGAVLDGKVTGITKFGVFVALPEGKTGMVHISEVASTFVKEIRDYVKEDQEVKVKIISIDPQGKISLSMKRAVETRPISPTSRPESFDRRMKPPEKLSFEDMMNKFKHDSDERMLDIKRCIESKRGSFSKRGAR